jgi:hypothetical protein
MDPQVENPAVLLHVVVTEIVDLVTMILVTVDVPNASLA